MPKRIIPHEHICPICGTTVGCEDNQCSATEWLVCEKKVCQDTHAAGTVHAAPEPGREELACCGQLPRHTPRGDRMTSEERKVTCKSRPIIPSLEERLTDRATGRQPNQIGPQE
jgi:hypothetical protein